MPKLLTVPLHEVDPPDLPMRASMDDQRMQELMDSISAIGQQQPCQVKKVKGRYKIITGHRRLVAHQRLHRPTLLVLLYEKGEIQEAAAMLAENSEREGVNRAEEAIWMAQLVEQEGATEELLCNLVHRSADYVGDNFRLLRTDPLVFQAVLERRINFSVARELNKCRDEPHRRYLLDVALRSGTNARVVKEWVDQHKAGGIVVTLPATSVPGADALPPAQPPILCCELCGGSRDPYNLKCIWIHNWELERIKEMIEKAATGG